MLSHRPASCIMVEWGKIRGVPTYLWWCVVVANNSTRVCTYVDTFKPKLSPKYHGRLTYNVSVETITSKKMSEE